MLRGKILALIVMLVSLLLLVLGVIGLAASNMLKNPGFEDGLKDWLIWNPGNELRLATTADIVHSGKFSGCIEGPTATAEGCFYQFFPVKPGEKYQLEAWVRADKGFVPKTDPKTGRPVENPIYAIVYFVDEKGGWLRGYSRYIQPSEVEEKWLYVKVTAEPAPNKAARVYVNLYIKGQGRVYWDDVSLMREETVTMEISAGVYPANANRSWAYEDVVHLISGEPGILSFVFYGDSSAFVDPALVVELPDGVTMEGAFCPHWKISGSPISYRNEGNRYEIPLFEVLGVEDISKGPKFETAVLIILKTQRAEGTASLKWYMYDSLEPDHRTADNEVKLAFLSPLEDRKLPRDFSIREAWWSGPLRCPEREIWDKLVALMEKVGVKGVRSLGEYPQIPEGFYAARDNVLRERGWKIYLPTMWVDGGPDHWVKSLGPKYPDADFWAVDKDGKPMPGVFCPSYIADKGAVYESEYEMFLTRASAWLKPGDVFVVDFEHYGSLYGTYNCCFCDRCLGEFAGYVGVPAKELTRQRILTEFRTQWKRFREDLDAQIVKVNRDILRSINPELTYAVCSGFLFPDKVEQERWLDVSAIDIRKFDSYVDLHMPQLYRDGLQLYDDLEANLSQLKSPVEAVLWDSSGHIATTAGSDVRTLSPSQVKMGLLAAATTGFKQVGFYTGAMLWEGLYLKKIQEAMAEIALIEDYLGGRRSDGICKITPQAPGTGNWVRSKVHVTDGAVLISLFNYSKVKADLNLSLTEIPFAGPYEVADPVKGGHIGGIDSGNKTWDGRALKDGLSLELPPEEVSFIVVKRSAQ